jgi:hypothetical protein
MKKLIKSLIKIFFVIVMPLISVALLFTFTMAKATTTVINTLGACVEEPFPITGIVLITVSTFILAVIVSKYLHYVHMLHKVTIEFLPMVGVGMGFDKDFKRVPSVHILLPLCALEITQHSKR